MKNSDSEEKIRALMALAAEAFGDKYNADPADPAMAHEWRIFSDGFQASARALAAVPAPSELQESVRWKQLVHMVERGVTPEILVDWINHPNRLDYAAKLRAEHG